MIDNVNKVTKTFTFSSVIRKMPTISGFKTLFDKSSLIIG